MRRDDEPGGRRIDDQVDWSEVLDWEERQDSTPFWIHAVAGSLAGVTEHVCLYPLDTIKTHMQAYRATSMPGSQSALAVVGAIRADFGSVGLLRGLPAVVVGVAPAHAAMFGTYEYVKARLALHEQMNTAERSDSVAIAAKGAIAGGVATIAHDSIMTPCDVIKQRMQLGCYESLGHCVRHMRANEGYVAFYRSVPITLAMNVPFGATFVACNENMKRFLRLADSGRPSEKMRVLPWYFVSAGISGAVASLVTQPFDVIKTRLQTQDVLERCYKTEGGVAEPFRPDAVPRYAGVVGALQVLYAEEGLRGFFRGAHVRMVVQIPSGALAWGTYEFIKSMLAPG
jgi:solute carrier family 25 iron transporter 28/37